MSKVWMADMTCLNCGKGFYPGYNLTREARGKIKTLGCNVCNHSVEACLTKKEFDKMIKHRDKNLESQKRILLELT